MSEGGSSFSPKAVLAMVLLGGALFVALLYMIGSGMATGSTNNGGGHAGGKGLNGYAALANLLERRGFQVSRSRNEGRLDDPGLLVLTPPHMADSAQLEEIVQARRYTGPTLVITPKWMAFPAAANTKGARQGWVQLEGARLPDWPGFLDFISVNIEPMRSGGNTARWIANGTQGELPNAEMVLSGSGVSLVPLVRGAQDGRILAAYVADGGIYPGLESLALDFSESEQEDDEIFPLVVVFEPDLINNYGLADQANAQFADRLFRAATTGSARSVTFDLTFNGLGRSANLLTLAFTPPFLAATLCLLIAAIAVAWRAFLRFGPPLRGTRAIAFGKQALIANAAGLIRRTRRYHLVAAPYAVRARERIMRMLALPRGIDAAASEAVIDRALASRQDLPNAFSTLAARLRGSRREADIVRAAQDIHSLERTLKR